MKKIILAGASLNSGNKGVNALTRGQITLLLDKYGTDIEIIILSYTVKEETNNLIKYNDLQINIKEIPCGKKKLIEAYFKSKTLGDNYIIKALKESDIILDISEGDSFSDIYGAKRFIQHSLVKLTAINLKKKLVIMPQTLGPFKSLWVKKVARNILNKADIVFVRDEISKKVALEELKVNREIKFIPDMAFYMKPDKNTSIDKFVESKESIKIGLNVSALLYNSGYNGNNMFNLKVDYKHLIDSLIEKLSKIPNTEIILIPHVMVKDIEVEDDFRVCKKMAEELNSKLKINIKTIDKYYREDEIKAIISGCDYFIGSRMHACIGAISSCVPTSPIAYSRKFIGIWDNIELGYCVTDPRKEEEKEIIDSIIDNFNSREKIKEKLNKEIPLLKEKIESIIDIINNK
ncbi:polysaccharide pyruvyl transferase family protein [Clostridium sp. D46t1_190503_E9]|uniref:polysaccharide pyruvyl transferase family protein n=1 Tax=Clostridium sp. D46t1_190503_E9 TaxID=2787137 RepID=UPI001896F1E2|nr:polysaccharide pyruvyl transferase family protein [Clostridium sp. D46t1_190503_E9]